MFYCFIVQQIVLLIEHSKAGRVVGPKGTNIQHIKFQSASTNLRIEKEVHVSSQAFTLNP